jgi:hypothetical protein
LRPQKHALWINGCLKNEAAIHPLQADVDEDGIINYEEFCQVGFKKKRIVERYGTCRLCC